MKLTTVERKAIFKGDHRALKREKKPDVKKGDKLILAWSRGGRQIVSYETGATVDIPRKATIWIEFMQPELKEGGWIVRFTAHDEREPLRLLASTPGPRSEAGLKTRWHDPSEVPEKGAEIVSWTLETERGYSGSGRTAIDPAEGVDDQYLTMFSVEARTRSSEFRVEQDHDHEEAARRKRERAIRDRLRETMSKLPPPRQVELMARIEAEIRKAAA